MDDAVHAIRSPSCRELARKRFSGAREWRQDHAVRTGMPPQMVFDESNKFANKFAMVTQNQANLTVAPTATSKWTANRR